MNGVGAADIRDAGLGKTEEPHFSLSDELADAAATSSIGTAGSMRC